MSLLWSKAHTGQSVRWLWMSAWQRADSSLRPLAPKAKVFFLTGGPLSHMLLNWKMDLGSPPSYCMYEDRRDIKKQRREDSEMCKQGSLRSWGEVSGVELALGQTGASVDCSHLNPIYWLAAEAGFPRQTIMVSSFVLKSWNDFWTSFPTANEPISGLSDHFFLEKIGAV